MLKGRAGGKASAATPADRFIAAGIYGCQWCNAAEIMRDYPGFDLASFIR